MPLVHMKDLLAHAYREQYAIGAYDIVSLEFLEAIVAGCEASRAPTILSLAESHFDHYDFDTLMPAVVGAARRATVPMAIHLDHGASLDSVQRAIRMGCTGVMVDASHLSFAKNVRITREVVSLAHGCGVPVEGELGYVAGVEGEDAEKHPGEVVFTSPEEAKRYVEETGVDCLAVSIGTVHGRMKGAPRLDLDRLAEINAALGVPLVIHGGTGLSEAHYRALIERGVAKINYYTALSDAAAESIRAQAAAHPEASYTTLLKGARQAIQAEVMRMNRVLGSEGRAEAAALACRPWREVEHAIAFNFSAELGPDEVRAAIELGRAQLMKVPGVRRVDVGEALTEGARYQLFWDIRFASEAVIDTYWRHPEHVDYADNVFRPYAQDRLKIDFSLLPLSPTDS